MKQRRKHKKLDPAFKALKQVVLALESCPEYMRKPTLEFAWNKYVTNAKPEVLPLLRFGK